MPQRVGVIGGGVAGLACARRLLELGADVVVFDTGKRAPGGRASSRVWHSALPADHAAQLCVASTPQFARLLEQLEAGGAITRYTGRLGTLAAPAAAGEAARFAAIDDGRPRFHGVKGMASFIGALAGGIDVRQDIWVPPSSGLRKLSDGAWEVREKARHRFDAIVIAHNGKCAARLTTPSAAQPARALHALLRVRFGARLRAARAGEGAMQLNSIYSLLFELPRDVLPSAIGDAVFVKGERSLRWLSNNAVKYAARDEPTHVWTALSSGEFGAAHKQPQEQLEGTEAEREISGLLLEAVERATGMQPGDVSQKVLRSKLQLWGAAVPLNRWDSDFVWDAEHAIGAAGDWLSADASVGSSVEAAWLSGVRLAEHVASEAAQRSFGLALGEEGGRFVPVDAGGFGSMDEKLPPPAWVAAPAAVAVPQGRRESSEAPRRKAERLADGGVGAALFLLNVPFDAAEEELQAHMESVAGCGGVTSVRFLYLQDGRPRGLAKVQMASAALATKCIAQLDGMPFRGRELRVRADTPCRS
ncbi:hypothetical protein AB1Y20_010843 [Prymnesium parvum]|uniref:RRM domain-containing protein n=1 Tax=Prymnesium parvum TaxID=97485 RepID=A0AB34ISF9_PRYPA